MAIRHFLDLDRLDTATLRHLLEAGKAYKAGGTPYGDKPLAGRCLVLIFEKPSTRTRVSFEIGMKQLGGHVVVLSSSDTQLGRGESIADTARVLSRYADALMIRTNAPQKLIELADYAAIPVINGLTDASHPCQVMADIMTYEEHRGSLEGKIVAWLGDGNNVANSWIHAAAHFGFTMRLACPSGLHPSRQAMDWALGRGARIEIMTDASAAVSKADLILTDTWLSMGCQDKNRHALLAPYQVNDDIMAKADAKALFMHCLPAHRGEEVTDSVIDGPHSVVWDEAENRLHVQKAILSWCLS